MILKMSNGSLKYLSMFIHMKCTFQQGCRTGSIGLAPGLQVPPAGTTDQEATLPSELQMPQPHLNRAPSITSAVDYEYFDVGIGQVVVKLPSKVKSSPKIELSPI